MTALVINGMFEDVLKTILDAEVKAPGKPHFLQPYSNDEIRLLADHPPSVASPTTLYMSVTDDLGRISYRATVVGWRDKRAIGSFELEKLYTQINQFHPGEEEIYLTVHGDKPCVNLISIVGLTKLNEPIPVSRFVKVSDGQPMKKKRSGWSYVEELPEGCVYFGTTAKL